MGGEPGNLIWIDLEMTGLEPERHHIIEIATVVTDPELEILARGPALPVRQPETVLADMDEWNSSHHEQSGLLARVRASPWTVADAERETLAFVGQWSSLGSSPICGNSICLDRRFLHRHMPRLEGWFHYRNLDVSTLKILAQRWAPDVAAAFPQDRLASRRRRHRRVDPGASPLPRAPVRVIPCS